MRALLVALLLLPLLADATPKKRHRHRRPKVVVVPEPVAPPVARPPTPEPPAEKAPAEEAPEPAPAANASGESPEASEPEPDAEPPAVEFEYQGYLRGRLMHAFVDPHALLSGIAAPLPENQATLEANIQPRLRLFDGHLTLASDFSAFTTTQAPYVSVLVSELYAQASVFDALYVLVGRRRVVWGTGLSWNPTDLVNPPRDLLEPARTRAGALMLPMVDFSLSAVTLSAFVSAPVTYDAHGLPVAVNLAAPVAGTRVFTSQFGVDMSLMYFYDAGKRRHSIGTAVSSVIAESYEVHAEGVLHLGAVDRPPMEAVDACGPALGTAPTLGGAAVIGVRRDGPDRSLVGVEYLFNSGGYTPGEYALVRSELPCLRAAAKVAGLQEPGRAPAIVAPVVLVRQHYLSVLAQRPHLTSEGWLEHLGVSGGAIVSLSDGSTILQARLDVSMRSGFVMSLVGVVFLPLDGGEMGLVPTRGLASLELQWSY
jgi:hypothetical protein